MLSIKNFIVLVLLGLIFSGCTIKQKLYYVAQPNQIKAQSDKSNKYKIIYIDNFRFNNTIGVYKLLGKDKDDEKTLIAESSINNVLKEQFKSQLSSIYNCKIVFVNSLPTKLDYENELYIKGIVQKLIIDENYQAKNSYSLHMITYLNKEKVETTENAILIQDNKVINREPIGRKIMTFATYGYIGSKIANVNAIMFDADLNMTTRLYLNDTLKSNIIYTAKPRYNILSSALSNIEQTIDITIYNEKQNVILKKINKNSQLDLSPNPFLYTINMFDGQYLMRILPFIYGAKEYKSQDTINKDKLHNKLELLEYEKGHCKLNGNVNSDDIMCDIRDTKNTEYYDLLFYYATSNGAIQNMIDSSISKLVQFMERHNE